MGDFRKKYKPQTHLRKEILPSPSKIQTELSTTNFFFCSYFFRAELSQNSVQSSNKQQHFKTRVFALIT